MTEATTTETPSSKGRTPTHRPWMVEDRPEGDPAHWSEISGLWATSGGDGISGAVKSWVTIPPGARLVVTKVKAKAKS